MSKWLAARLATTPEHLSGRLRWLVYRHFLFAIRRWHRVRTCAAHEPVSLLAGTLADLVAGGGHQRVACGRCGVTLRDFPA